MVEDLIKRLREQSQGRVKWFAMNKAETAYFIDFNSGWDARRWLDDQNKRMSEWLEREGVHLVEQRVFTELEELAKQAADLLEQQAARIAELTTCNLCNSTGNSTPCAYPTEINRQQAKRLTALESERDALLAAAGKEAVGQAGAMPGTDGFTMACFKASDVPIGTPLYTAPTAAPEKGDGFSETTRLDFLIDQQAWVQWAMRDGSIRQCQVYTQDEDENYHVLSGEDRYFNAPREAIDAALSQKAGEQQ
jgi:hypothetical protein